MCLYARERMVKRVRAVWPDSYNICSIFGDLQQWKFAQKDKFSLRLVQYFTNTKLTLKYCQRLFNFAKVVKFLLIWSHCVIERCGLRVRDEGSQTGVILIAKRIYFFSSSSFVLQGVRKKICIWRKKIFRQSAGSRKIDFVAAGTLTATTTSLTSAATTTTTGVEKS